jgi:hypothetical protein
MSPEEKFLSKIAKDVNAQSCWYLTSDDGSGFKTSFYVNRKRFRAKKFSYEHFVGKAPPRLKILCKCGNKLCVNPDHHFVGNGQDQISLILASGWKHKRGWKQKPEVVKKSSETHKGKIISQELRERLSKANLGKKHNLETRQKMSENRMGIGVTEEARQKIALSKQGEKNWNTRLTPEDILKIRKLAGNDNSKPKSKRTKLGEYTITEIAEMFGISPVHVINIRKRKVWKHIE